MVVCSANILGQAVEVFIVLIFCGFEHHVFEQVREARTARRVVFASDVIPDLNRCGGALMVLNGKDRQPVGQSALPIFQRRDSQRCRRGLRLPMRWGHNARDSENRADQNCANDPAKQRLCFHVWFAERKSPFGAANCLNHVFIGIVPALTSCAVSWKFLAEDDDRLTI